MVFEIFYIRLDCAETEVSLGWVLQSPYYLCFLFLFRWHLQVLILCLNKYPMFWAVDYAKENKWSFKPFLPRKPKCSWMFFCVCVCMFVCLVVVGFFYSQFRDAVNNFSSRCFCNAASFFFFSFHRAFLGKSQPKCCNRENFFMDPFKLQLLQNVFRDRLLPY